MLAGLSRSLWYAFTYFHQAANDRNPSLEQNVSSEITGSRKSCLIRSSLSQHSGRFSDMNGLEEVAIIVPFRLYITHYTPSPLCTGEGTDRPTIHVGGHAFTGPTIHLEGEIGGDAWESDRDTRAMWGTVSTCADGSIRWCMVRRTLLSVWLPHVLIIRPAGSTRRQRTIQTRRNGYLKVSKWVLSDRE